MIDALPTRVAVRAILPLSPVAPAPTVRPVTRARTDTKTDLTEALGLALALADEAAAVTLAWFGDRLPVELKADATPVTEVDRAAEAAIRAHLAAHAPDDAVLGEEHGEREGTSGRTWVIDPVDGTRLYAEGIPLWTTLIALVVDGSSVLGVADAPALGVRYRAIRGGGAWRDDHRLTASDVGALADAFVGHSPLEEWMRAGDERHLRDLAAGAAEHPRTVRRLGTPPRRAGLDGGDGRARAVLPLGLVGHRGHRRGGRWTYHDVGGRGSSARVEPVGDERAGPR